MRVIKQIMKILMSETISFKLSEGSELNLLRRHLSGGLSLIVIETVEVVNEIV